MKTTKRTGPPAQYRLTDAQHQLRAEEARAAFQASAPAMTPMEEHHLRFVVDLRATILARIQASGLRQKEMARRMGTTESAVSRLLNDEIFNPTLETIMKIEVALGEQLLFVHADTAQTQS